MWINFLIYECHLSYQTRFLMLGYLSRYEVDLSVQITVAQLVKELRIDQVTVRKNLAELCENGLMEETTVGLGKRGRPVKTYALSGKFISLLGQPNQIPLQLIPYLENLGLHNHYERKGRFRNGMGLSKGESLLLAVLITLSNTSRIVKRLPQAHLSRLTGEKISTVKANLRNLENEICIIKISTRNTDDILNCNEHYCYLINFERFSRSFSKMLKIDAFQPIPTLMLSDDERKGIFDISAFDKLTMKLYDEKRRVYLKYLELFKHDVPGKNEKVRTFLNVNAAYLTSIFLREHWGELEVNNRIPLATVESIFSKHLQHIASLFKGSVTLTFEPDNTNEKDNNPSSDNSSEEASNKSESQIFKALNDYPKLKAACCFFLFFDVLSLAIKVKLMFSHLNIPNLDHKNIFLSQKIFTNKYRMTIHYLENDSRQN